MDYIHDPLQATKSDYSDIDRTGNLLLHSYLARMHGMTAFA